MLEQRHLVEKRTVLFLFVLLTIIPLSFLLFDLNSEDDVDQQVFHWDGAYGAQYPYIADYAELASRGINLVVNNITTEPAQWERYYREAVNQNLKIIPVLWGDDQTAWRWNQEANEWELDINKYPESIGAQFLQFLRVHPIYLENTFAIYAFHEPFNPENPRFVSPARIRRFWQQIHEEEFPNQALMIYGESISWNSACTNGCVDFDTIGLYNFTRCGLFGLWRYRTFSAVPSKDGVLIQPGSCALNQKRIIQAGKQLIDDLFEFIQASPPAPDGSRTRIFALIQTFAQENPGLSYRMPQAEEMYAWSTQIVYPEGEKLAGMQWYVFRFDGLYDQTLGDDRYDAKGADRWQTIREVADVLFGTVPEYVSITGFPAEWLDWQAREAGLQETRSALGVYGGRTVEARNQ